ncbi:Gag-Pol polyprotein [Trichuris trichiura]|uniref:Gag-Pol polyprotein n=1 Tax=Trichuris trichiura TaxID=36087 RepID=A0A077ZKW8_TRITR|nr:Gag-Pol polyprotein [Trichuris trichiura]
MPAPSDQSYLRSFLGLVNYHGDFVHELSKMRAPFDALLRKGARWEQSSEKGVPSYTANRLKRWDTTLLSYDFIVEYRFTENSGRAAALSRLVDKHTVAEEDLVIVAVNAEHDVRRCLSDSIHVLLVTSEPIS